MTFIEEQIYKNKDILKKLFNTNINSSTDICEQMPNVCKSGYKIINIISTLKLIRLDHLITDSIPYFQHAVDRLFVPSIQSYYRTVKPDEALNSLIYFYMLSKKDNTLPYFKSINKDFFDTYLPLHMTKNNFSAYVSLLKIDGCKKINNIYEIMKTEHYESTKISLNTLIEAFIFEKDERFLHRFIKIFPIVYFKDPSLKSIQISDLLKELESSQYNEELKKSIKKLVIIDSNEFFTEINNRFAIELDIEKISLLRKNNALLKDGSSYVVKMDRVLNHAKELGLKYCDSYIDRKEENLKRDYQSKDRHDVKTKVSANFLKKFEFTFNSQEDMSRKNNIFKQFFQSTILLDTENNNDEFLNILKTIVFAQILEEDLNIQDNQSIQKNKKSKI